MRAFALVVVPAVLLSGCGLIGGSSGEFEVEGESYRASRVECGRTDGRIVATLTAGAAAMQVVMTDGPEATVEAIHAGQRGGPALLEMADGTGQAEVVRTEDRFELSGVLVHTQHSQNAPVGKEEEFTASFTCGRYSEG
ncbi:lipoprotein LpqH [Granulicoccus sp. GXG6511]|uniref:lipoprotein LpqH n=1 Tax=Granulicoccus sp. GXG6511 TaxID=3381351 RepID=UPI003D7D7F7A